MSNILSNHRLNPIVVNALSRVLSGSWNECLKNSGAINKSFKWYLLSIILSKFSAIFYLSLRIFIGLILAALGILFSPTHPSNPDPSRR